MHFVRSTIAVLQTWLCILTTALLISQSLFVYLVFEEFVCVCVAAFYFGIKRRQTRSLRLCARALSFGVRCMLYTNRYIMRDKWFPLSLFDITQTRSRAISQSCRWFSHPVRKCKRFTSELKLGVLIVQWVLHSVKLLPRDTNRMSNECSRFARAPQFVGA